MKHSRVSLWNLLSILLVAAIVLVSAGCAGRTPSAVTPTLSSNSLADDEVVITFAAGEFQRAYFEALIETFHEQNPEITVQFVDLYRSFPPDMEWNSVNYLRTVAQSADAVIIQGPSVTEPGLDISRYFRDLRPLYESDPSFEPDDFWPGILTACEDTYGNMVGLPLTATVNGIFYDEAAFDSAGVPQPAPGWTWDNLRQAITALTERRGSQVKYGLYDAPDIGSSVLAATVSDHLRAHGGEVDANELLQEVQWYIDLARAGMLSGVRVEEDMENYWDERMKLFEDDALRPAMWPDSILSSVYTGDPTYDENDPFAGMAIRQFGFAPMPVAADGSSTNTSRSWVECAAVSAGSQNPRAAWAWLNFLSKQWFTMDKTQMYEIGRPPSRRSVADSDGYWDLLPAKVVPAVRFALEHGSYDLNYSSLFGEISIALAKTIKENADFEQVYETAFAARPATPTPVVDNAPIVVATPRAPLPEGVTAIKYYVTSYNQEELNALTTLVEQFNQSSSNIYVEWLMEFHGDPGDDWLSSIANNVDCFTADIWGDFNTGSMLNLNSLMSKEPASFRNDFSPQMMEAFSRDGNLYALPAARRLQMVAYNADLLARRGLTIPENDWTFEDFLEMASTVASTSDADPSYGFMFSPYDEFLALGQGVKWGDLDSNPPKVFYDSPEMRNHLQWLAQMKKDHVIFDQENGWEQMETVITSGQVAFWLAMMGEKNPWYYGSGQQAPYKISMAPLPETAMENPMTSWSNDRGHYISAQTQNSQACWEWFKFLSEQPNLFSGVPARLSLAESPAWEAYVGKEDAAAYRVAFANTQPIEVQDSTMQQLLWPLSDWRSQTVKGALEGKDIQEVQLDMQNRAETYLDCVLALDMDRPPDELNQDAIACMDQANPPLGPESYGPQ